MIETIVAPVTAPGHAGVSVVRVSGPLTRTLLESFALQGRKAARRPREMVFTGIRIGGQDAQILHDAALAGEILDGEILDQGMVVWFPAPGSFTVEDCAEFHLHGSPYIVNTLIKGLCVAGARLAKPGEFTERAFHNGKIDLCQAEAVADLIAAETELQARAAREQLEGRLSGAIA